MMARYKVCIFKLGLARQDLFLKVSWCLEPVFGNEYCFEVPHELF
jgi:hypothetical protein